MDVKKNGAEEQPEAPQARPKATPRPVAPQPRPIARPRPVAPAPRPVAPRPRPVAPAPRPVAPRPRPVAPAPRPVAPQPRPVALRPRPVAQQPVAPRPVAPAPRPVAPRPVAPAPRPVAPQPRPVAPQPVAPAPRPIAPRPVEPKPEILPVTALRPIEEEQPVKPEVLVPLKEDKAEPQPSNKFTLLTDDELKRYEDDGQATKTETKQPQITIAEVAEESKDVPPQEADEEQVIEINDNSLVELETKIAHMKSFIDELSDVVTEQDESIQKLIAGIDDLTEQVQVNTPEPPAEEPSEV